METLVEPIDMQGGFVTAPLTRAEREKHTWYSKYVIEFWEMILESGLSEFTADDLRAHIRSWIGRAPAEPQQVMLKLKKAGKINYEVISRRRSIYRALPLGVNHGE